MLRIYASGASAQSALTKLIRWVRYLDEVPNIADLAQMVEHPVEARGAEVRSLQSAPNNRAVLNRLRGLPDTQVDVSSNLTCSTKQCASDGIGIRASLRN